MLYSKTLIPTRKEDPVDAELPSHKLLLRAGYMEQLTAGIYDLLPLAHRSLQRIAQIVREELNRAGAQELLLPLVQPAEIWQQSGRWDFYGKELLRFVDRKNQSFCLGPTHEEVITDLARRHIRSYKQMPINLYQIQVKFRDEIRPRGGLMRGREFMMKDGYSFDASYEDAEKSYAAMYEAYSRIFKRCGLAFRAVEADSGNIGGSHSHEFQVLAQTGEDRILACSKCGYAANVEKAEVKRDFSLEREFCFSPRSDTPVIEEVHTPDRKSIDEISEFLGREPEAFIKTLVYLADNEPVVVLMRGKDEVNEIKLRHVLNCQTLLLASDSAVREVTGAASGFAGPVDLKVRIVADYAVCDMHDAITGANKTDYHILHVEPGRDFRVSAFADLIMADAGSACARCGGAMEAFRGIEVGHVFLLGTKYSVPMNATYLDAAGEAHPMVMGCYGIGLTRVLAAAIEQCHDEHGIAFPAAIAPFDVILCPIQVKNEKVMSETFKLYEALKAVGLEVLLDDRNDRPGSKFKDADLIGIPYRINVGEKNLNNNLVEVFDRKSGTCESVSVEDAVRIVSERIKAEIEASKQ